MYECVVQGSGIRCFLWGEAGWSQAYMKNHQEWGRQGWCRHDFFLFNLLVSTPKQACSRVCCLSTPNHNPGSLNLKPNYVFWQLCLIQLVCSFLSPHPFMQPRCTPPEKPYIYISQRTTIPCKKANILLLRMFLCLLVPPSLGKLQASNGSNYLPQQMATCG